MHESTGFRWFRRVGLTFLVVITALPLYVIVSSSAKPLIDVQGVFSWIPSRVTLTPYRDMWTTIPLGRYVANSLVVAVSSTLLAVAVAVFAAYALSRFAFRGRRMLSMAILASQMAPGIFFLVPLFLLFVQINSWLGIQLTGSYAGLIITYLTFALPFSIWMLAGYFAGLPREVEEAALVDGLGRIAVLLRIVVPMARPAIVAVAVFAFVLAWSEVLFASVLTNASTRTLAVGLQSYASQSSVLWNQMMAASVVVSLPVVVGFLYLQRYLVRGLTTGAV